MVVGLDRSFLNAMGHVGQARYHDLLDHGRDATFAPFADAEGVYPFVLVRVELDHRSELRANDRQAVVETVVEAVGRRTVRLGHRILGGAGRIAAEGASILAAYDLTERRSRDVSDAERAILVPSLTCEG